ncbi:sulfurtransferase [Olleya sp. R77988]|uniref:sulfurtransferase n=1 Tax=Olleya sp. R77988 TaxID=3093875 RepID=UPI0037C7C4A3
MNWKINSILFLLVLISCKEEQKNETNNEIKKLESSYLIEANILKDIVNQPNIKVIDFRKKDIYNNEHIEGAVNIWRRDIEDASYDYGGIMASQTQIETLFGKLGIKTDDTLVIYDDIGLCDASRLWWLLQNYNFDNVKMLHGGITSWKAIGGKVTKQSTIINNTIFKLPETSGMKYFVSKESVLDAIKNKVVILDTRTPDEFSGKRQKKGAAKGGRIPTSIHIDWAEAVDYKGDKRLKTIENLKQIYNKLNIKKNDPIIVYCHSGVRSSHTTFVLTQLLGYTNVKNYDGSWTEWSHFNHLPFETNNKL